MIQPVAERTPAGTSYLSVGQGQPVVLIHGVGLNKEMWGGQFVGLANDYRVIAYDMLGHGQSALPAADIGLEGYAAQLAELLDHLQIAQATVIGFSMGGLVARAFALEYPQRLAALVVLNSVFNRTPSRVPALSPAPPRLRSLAPTPTSTPRSTAGSVVNTRLPTRRRSPPFARCWQAMTRRVTTPLIRCSPPRTCTAQATWAASRCRR